MGFSVDNWQMNCLVLMAETIVLRVIAYCIYKFRLRKLNKNGIIYSERFQFYQGLDLTCFILFIFWWIQ